MSQIAVQLYLAFSGAVVCFILLPLIGYAFLCQSAKKEVKTSPRVPMFVCEKHGPFPTRSVLKITVPGQKYGDKDLTVDVCPFCYDDKMRSADQVLKQKEATRTK